MTEMYDDLKAPDHHGTAIENLDDCLILYMNRKQAWVAQRKLDIAAALLSTAMLPTALDLYAFGMPAVFLTIVLCIEAVWFFGMIYLCTVSHLKLSQEFAPIIPISASGVQIHSPHVELCIPWDELERVISYKDLGHRYVLFIPKNLPRTLRTGSRITRISARMNQFSNFITLRRKTPPLSLEASQLPLDVDDVAEQINQRKSHFQVRSSSEPRHF